MDHVQGTLFEDVKEKLYEEHYWKERRAMGLGFWAIRNAEAYPERVAIVDLHYDRRLTYKEFNSRINSLANGLLRLGINKGDLVAFLFFNSYQFLEIIFALAKLGAVAVPINSRLAPAEYGFIINNCQCKVLIFGQEFLGNVESVRDQLHTVKYFICEDSCPEWSLHYETLIRESPDHEPTVRVYLEEPCLIAFTGGTTGLPKSVLHSHIGCILNILSHALDAQLRHFDTVVNVAPLYHLAELHLVSMSTFFLSGTNIFPKSRGFNPAEVLQIIEQYGVGYAFIVPAMAVRILNLPNLEDYPLKSLHTWHTAGSAMPFALKEKIISTFPHLRLIEGYGIHEGIQLSMLQPEDQLRKPESVGKPCISSRVRVVNTKGEDCRSGEVGEIIGRTGSLALEYYRNPGQTNETWRSCGADRLNQWLYTGDLGKFDDEGYLYIVDRRKDMVISGGENVYSMEVEGVIQKHPSIQEVAVAGLADETWGEMVTAFVVMKRGESLTSQELIQFCRERLAGYKCPKLIQFMEELPRTPFGKVDKNMLRAMKPS